MKARTCSPVYKKYIGTHFEEGYDDPDRPWEKSTFNCRHRVKFDLFNRYGLIAAAGDRHLAEFMPGNTYLNDPETVRSWKFGLTTVDFRTVRWRNAWPGESALFKERSRWRLFRPVRRGYSR